jgi:uncharacterized protein YegP (UPF0339 family)
MVPFGALASLVAAAALTVPSAAQDKKAKGAAAGAAFEINLDKQGKYRFKMVDGNGETVAIGVRGYEDVDACQAAVDYIKKEAAKAKVSDETKGKAKAKPKTKTKTKDE